MTSSHLPVVTVNVFPGGFNWGVYVGLSKGLFAEAGIAVEVQDTPNSVTQMTDFSRGKFDIAMTAVDNIVAYVEGQGEAPIGPQGDFVAVMGSDSGFLSLVASPSISRIEDLRGKTVSVDAATTGYAFVLYEILRRHGLDKDKGDYEIARAGGMVQRWNALREGQHAATLLSAPYNIVAQNAGFRELVKATDVIGPYQGNVAAVRRSWARGHRDKVAAYIRSYRRAIAWLYEPSNRSEAIAILRHHLPQMTQEMAEASYGELLHPARGFFHACEIVRSGLDCVLELRSRYGLPKKQLNDPDKYCDLGFG
ncbi:MAG TPA: ABC transporter substrate-binding protein [Bradyrhizobium sp.]|uniref:ABC transporter substrate-binding protein n=1 Tax=Bradyrhizobium sp. TaxID=376 RepID=UPI002D7FB8B5|nr:ABC transporter substrate-binding protein [Bradyrhizobium sp.]HET7889151.1 ABC transporter substrate-binding protein [Bradyrhizobium sp.]